MSEKQKELNSKWEVLLDDLSKNEAVKYRYAQSYERIVKQNKQDDYKILLGIAHRVFAKNKEIKPTRGKTKIFINEFEDSDFIIQGTMMIDLILPFIEATADMIIDECVSHGNAFSHIERIKNKIFLVV